MKPEKEEQHNQDKTTVKLLFHSVLYVIGWCLFSMVVLPLAFPDEGQSPCEATPSLDFGRSACLLLAYLILFGSWWIWLGRHLDLPKARLRMLTPIIVLLPYFIAVVLAIVFYEDITRSTFESWGLFSWFYTHGCYNDVEVKEQAIFSLAALFLLPVLYATLSYLNKKQ